MLWASLNLEDAAQLSYMRLAREEGNQSWRRFSELLNTRFGPPLRSHPLGEVSTCRRNSEVTEYQDRFLGLLVRASTLSGFQQVQLFTVGLGEPLSIDVQMQNPQTPEVAMNLARSFEQRELVVAQATRLQHRGILPTPTTLAPPAPKPSALAQIVTSSSTSVAASSQTVTVAGWTIKHMSPEEMEAGRRDGLCFNCDEKYVRGHNKVCAHLFLLDLHDDEDEELEAVDTEEPLISLYTIAGVCTGDTMQVSTIMGGATLRALLDSGSTHNFIFEEAATHTNLQYQPYSQMKVTVANGERVPCMGVVRHMPFTIDEEHFVGDFFTLPLAGYDVVLGMQWLTTLGLILWDFGRLTMSFWRGDHRV